ncbi:MAG: sugar ABC transporter permease [Hamadaea sp.]|uniref:carbohydrate ABC transporter permease n=1 Tax=Hamadaea sp. TaxID=2024425 RepID=UPI0018544C35|nr:sugar ABC transporter permease [Hamadaea sp.]NUT19625.1 sugar ABC transporter permease [Hamadaea sp.]
MTVRTAEARRANGPTEEPGRTPERRRKWRRSPYVPWLFLAPALILIFYFKYLPMAYGLRMSFYEVRGYLGDLYVGGQNYSDIVTDDKFTAAAWHSVVLAVGTTAGSMFFGLILALLLEGSSRTLWFVRTAAFLPVVTTIAVAAEVWRILYHPAADGPLNSILGLIGISPQPFLADEQSSLLSVMGVGIWRGAPYDMMIFLAGLAGVDRSLYESSAVDGANTWHRFRHVTVPALRPVFAILITLAAIRGIRVFTEVFLLTNGAPNGSTEVLMTLIYKLGLQQGKLGIAAAGSILLFGATVVLTVAVRALRRREV